MPSHQPSHQPGDLRPEPVLAVGLDTLDLAHLGHLLVRAGVEQVVDVRRDPGAEPRPGLAQDAMSTWLPAQGVGYRWEPRLAEVPAAGEPEGGLEELARSACLAATAVLGPEPRWWCGPGARLADALVRREVPVLHLRHDGRLVPHEPGRHAG